MKGSELVVTNIDDQNFSLFEVIYVYSFSFFMFSSSYYAIFELYIMVGKMVVIDRTFGVWGGVSLFFFILGFSKWAFVANSTYIKWYISLLKLLISEIRLQLPSRILHSLLHTSREFYVFDKSFLNDEYGLMINCSHHYANDS